MRVDFPKCKYIHCKELEPLDKAIIAVLLEGTAQVTSTELHEALKAEEVLAQELSRYAGRWVAIDNDRCIVASAISLEALLSRVDPGGLDRIIEVSSDPVAACLY